MPNAQQPPEDLPAGPAAALPSLVGSWEELAARADGFFDRVLSSQRQLMRCGPTCDACCQDDLDLLPMEALVVLSGLSALDPGTREAVRGRANASGPPCALLHRGLCTLYRHRPLLCRTHGLPLLYDPNDLDGLIAGSSDGAAQEPELSWCPLNFVDDPPPNGAVLRASVLYAALAVSDQLALRHPALADVSTDRVSIRALASHGWAALVSPHRG